MTDPFSVVPSEKIGRLIDEFPLCWIVPAAAPQHAMLMPVLREGADALQSLLGHLPRRHPLTSVLRDRPEALFLFQGPHSYVSPEWLTDKNWAPTWNFAAATIIADVRLDDALTDESLTHIVQHMEAKRPSPWTADALGDRYATLKQAVIGFRAPIRAIMPRFKLGQDERADRFEQIVDGLGDHVLADWMLQSKTDR